MLYLDFGTNLQEALTTNSLPVHPARKMKFILGSLNFSTIFKRRHGIAGHRTEESPPAKKLRTIFIRLAARYTLSVFIFRLFTQWDETVEMKQIAIRVIYFFLTSGTVTLTSYKLIA